jgi:hypothetical protein
VLDVLLLLGVHSNRWRSVLLLGDGGVSHGWRGRPSYRRSW